MCCVVAQDAGPGIPVFVFLSPGVDVAADVEALGRRLGFTAANGKYAVVSLGQVGLCLHAPSSALDLLYRREWMLCRCLPGPGGALPLRADQTPSPALDPFHRRHWQMPGRAPGPSAQLLCAPTSPPVSY